MEICWGPIFGSRENSQVPTVVAKGRPDDTLVVR